MTRYRLCQMATALSLVAVLALGCLACSAQEFAVEGLDVQVDQSVLLAGQKTSAQVSVWPEEAGQVGVEWSSSQPDLVQVDESGVVHAGNAAHLPDEGVDVDIWARAKDGSLAMDCATVRVMPSMRSLTVSEKSIVLSTQDSPVTGVVAEIEPVSLVGLARIAWESADQDIATVSPSGNGEVAMIYGKTPGETVVTVHALDGSGCVDSMVVIVE